MAALVQRRQAITCAIDGLFTDEYIGHSASMI